MAHNNSSTRRRTGNPFTPGLTTLQPLHCMLALPQRPQMRNTDSSKSKRYLFPRHWEGSAGASPRQNSLGGGWDSLLRPPPPQCETGASSAIYHISAFAFSRTSLQIPHKPDFRLIDVKRIISIQVKLNWEVIHPSAQPVSMNINEPCFIPCKLYKHRLIQRQWQNICIYSVMQRF